MHSEHHIYESIELAATSGSQADIACALLAHPYCLQLSREQLELHLSNADKLWDAVRFVSESEVAASRLMGADYEQ